ncbi:MAG: hypothetical protein JSW66_15675 [Phycisphaerales bacterium]|nr:MAG: hypothetical protein JSW66_15675 [Phycisphaerales bacterium]
MNKSFLDACSKTAVVSFVAGIIVGTGGFTLLMLNAAPTTRTRIRRTQDARVFFYAAMRALFEGTYDPNDSSISEEALNTFRKYESRLGGKCYAQIHDESSGYHWGMVLFPSGDIFEVIIMRDAEQLLMLKEFAHQDWDKLWSDEIARTHRSEHTLAKTDRHDQG